MNKELSKPIINKSKLKNRHLKSHSKGNYLGYEKIKNNSDDLLKKSKKVLKNILEKVLHQLNLFGIQSNVLLAVKEF